MMLFHITITCLRLDLGQQNNICIEILNCKMLTDDSNTRVCQSNLLTGKCEIARSYNSFMLHFPPIVRSLNHLPRYFLGSNPFSCPTATTSSDSYGFFVPCCALHCLIAPTYTLTHTLAHTALNYRKRLTMDVLLGPNTKHI